MQINIANNTLDFNRFFPFFFVVDHTLQIKEIGKSLEKIFPDVLGKDFKAVFKFVRPWSITYTYESIIAYHQQLFILEGLTTNMKFRWQVVPLQSSSEILFIGTPWITSIEEMTDKGLLLKDFALHDTLPDIFQFLKASEVNTNDIRLLAEELKNQKDLLQEVIDILPHQIFLKDLHSRFVLVNKKVEEIFGAPASQIVGKTYHEFHQIPSLDGEYDLSDKQVIQTRQKVELNHEPQVSITGKYIINNILKLPFVVKGELKGVLGIAVDISEKIASEYKLKDSEDRYRALIENALDIIYQTDVEGKFVFLNALAEVILEFSMDELLQMTYIDLIRDDYKAITKDYYLSKGNVDASQNDYFEFPVITKSGKEIWISQKVQPFYNNQKMVGYQGVARDITQFKILEEGRVEAEDALKETATRFKSLIENLNYGILVADENRNIVAVNDAFCKLFNISVLPTDLIGDDCNLVNETAKVLFKNSKWFIENINEKIVERKLVTEEELVMLNGHVLERDYIPIFVKNDYRGHLWSYKDVTLRKFEENELLKSKELAEASSIAKEQFLSTMSHEIRTPMNAVIGMTQLLMNKEPKEDQVEYLNAIKYSADNLLGLINNILDFSKIESGKITLENNDFDITDLVQKIKNIFKYQSEEKGLKFSIHLDHEVDQYLKGDTVRLNQILTNLVGNALKFTEFGRVEILISKVATAAQKINILFEIRDTGIGIDPEKADKIFERFTQANSDTTRKYGGTGLGLTITKLLVELLGGTIYLESQVNRGSSFFVELPFDLGSKDNVVQSGLKLKEMEGQLSGKTILLVEDNKLNQFIASEFIKNSGIAVLTAENGKEALQQLEHHSNIDLILMDLQMPVMDGYTATEHIRKNYNGKYETLPIIALSAATSVEVRNKVAAVGMNDYVSKPFEFQSLYIKIAQYLTLAPVAPKKKTIPTPVENHGVVNLSYYEEFSGGNKDFVKEMIKVYLEETPSILFQLNDFVVENNHAEIASACHKLKSSFKMMGVEANDVQKLEELAKTAVLDFPLFKKLNNKIQKKGLDSILALKTILVEN